MLFHSLVFFAFLAFVLSGLTIWRGKRTAQHVLLLVASYAFYGWWDWRFCFLILASSVLDYGVALRIAGGETPATRRRWLLVSVVANLSLLGVFKYANFFLSTIGPLLHGLGLSTPTIEILLPVGISFFTFQSMSYTIDVYRRRIEAERSPLRVLLFVSFFPQLVAGPIVRAAEFLPQLDTAFEPDLERLIAGSQRFMIGMVKKRVCADNLAPFVDAVFANPGLYDTPTLWLAVVAYAIQIFCDFSGYSDMAIGIGRILGYRFPENFLLPYTSTSITEFWRRWHVTLSSWLRDYLYISLGGNRGGELRTYRNLFLVMFLGGLWHGASWNFVVWGAIHGVALAIERRLTREERRREARLYESRWGNALGWVTTLTIVLVAWVFFRATSFPVAFTMLGRMFSWSQGVGWLPTSLLLLFPAVVTAHLVGIWLERRGREEILPAGHPLLPVAFTSAVLLCMLLGSTGSSPFVYFQF
jgi:alginate O-acetyltransferase complex protein AlgI